MKDYTISEQYALIGLDGQEALHSSLAKNAAIRGIKAARLLEKIFPDEREEERDPARIREEAQVFQKELESGLEEIRKMNRKTAKKIEEEISAQLKGEGALEECADLLACDMYYTTSGVNMRTYRTERELYVRLTEGLRAEILEEGPVTLEGVSLLWLLRETCCMHQIFSVSEQEQIESRMLQLSVQNPIYAALWQADFHSSLEKFAAGFVLKKKNLFKNPYLEGVNLIYPFLDRRQAIFIDLIVLGTSVKDRRTGTIHYLAEHGHHVEEIPYGEETLLKIDNGYYRIFPATRYSKLPIQGVELLPAYK